jgi:hypothetical protein
MSTSFRTDTRRLMGWATFAGGSFVVLFWILYFTRAVDLGQHDRMVNAFESAFPIADAVFAAALFAASVALLRGNRLGPFFLVVAGAMSLYLGIIDATFYAAQGHYYPISTEGVVGLVINVLCIGGGALALWRGSKWLGPFSFEQERDICEHVSRSRIGEEQTRRSPDAGVLAGLPGDDAAVSALRFRNHRDRRALAGT